MNQQDVRLLAQITGYPCVTITMQTHRASPENRQDLVRLKNLTAEATDRLLKEFNKRDVEAVLKRLENLTGTIDFRNTLDGLALFVNQGFGRAFRMPFQVQERVVIGETFFTRNLVYSLNQSTRYWVLVLSEKPTRIYEGLDHSLTEINEGFPINHEGLGGEARLPGGFGIPKSAYRDERHRQFFRKVDNTVKPFLANDPLPLLVVGVERYHAFFNEVSVHTNAIVGRVAGSHDKTSPHELSKQVQPLIEKYRGEKRKFSSSLGEVWRPAHEGRGDLLLVEDDFHYPARLDEDGVPVRTDNPTAPDVIDDAVAVIIDTILNKQGKVVFVENGKLEEHRRIALILRY